MTAYLANVAISLIVLSTAAGMAAYTGSVLGAVLGAQARTKLSGDR